MASMRNVDVNLIHFILRLLIAVGSFLSAIFKIPFIIFAAQFIIDFAMKKINEQQQPPPPPSSPDSDGKQFDLSLPEVALNILFLIALFTSVLVILTRTVYQIARGLAVNTYVYLIIMGLWVVYIIAAIMTDTWKGPLNYAVLVTRFLLIGWFAVEAPATWHFILLRISIITDIIAYPLIIALAILNFKYAFLNDCKVGVWTRYNNLIRTL